MKKLMLSYLQALFGKELELRVKLFHVLAITGFVLCVIMTGVSLASNMPVSTLINMSAGIISLTLLIYSAKSGRYRFCYWATILVIFFILFPSLFLSGGGYRGGMPFFFVFAVIFTVYMLDGWGMLVITTVELIFYSLLCVLAYQRPEIIVPFASEAAVVTDIIIGLVAVSISLGATMFIQIHMYQKQQTQLEQAQQDAEAASRTKSAFLANMSHEIRTPIHMILSMNELIHRESSNHQVQEYVEKIEETGKILLSLVDSVLDVSKIESGKMELMPEPYESSNLVRTLALIGKVQCSRKKLHFRFHADDDLPPVLHGDLTHIRQIALNFLSNAAKYTDSGSVTLSITWEPSEISDEIFLCISVQDTGCGIPEEAIPTLFEAFTRVDLPAHRSIEGTGLGLTIVRDLTKLMGGTVSIDSKPDVGSTFSVRFPQKVLTDEQDTQDISPMSFQAPSARMLVVDDNEGNRMIMRKLLSDTMMQVDTASSGSECLQKMRANQYHIILMDYMMPEMDGLETMELLKQIPDFHTPVIALTADASAETSQRLLDAGFSSYLTKPLLWPQMRQVLLSYLPDELVTLVPEDHSQTATTLQNWELEDELSPYCIILTDALQYFNGNLREYCTMAELFLRHDITDWEKVKKLQQNLDCKQLRFPIHALKGKSRNLGMTQLSDVCAHIEELCLLEDQEEIQSLLPYLLFLWKRGREGLILLLQKEQLTRVQDISHNSPDNTVCCKQLTQLIQEFRRKPSLECIRQLLLTEPTREGQQRLHKLQELVDAVSFEQAQTEWTSYLKWKEEERRNELSDTYSGDR